MPDSDTPRTNKLEASADGMGETYFMPLCRKLEREVNALKRLLGEVRPLIWDKILAAPDAEVDGILSKIKKIDFALTQQTMSGVFWGGWGDYF